MATIIDNGMWLAMRLTNRRIVEKYTRIYTEKVLLVLPPSRVWN